MIGSSKCCIFVRRAAAAALCCWFALTPAFAQLVGTLDVPGDYADLEAAITDLNAQGVGPGGVVINLLPGNPQTAPASGYTIELASNNAAADRPITLRGNGNTVTAFSPQPLGTLLDAIIRIVGEDHVTVEDFVLQENGANTTVFPTSSNRMTEFGIAIFYRSVTDGAHNVTLRGNTIRLGTFPPSQIYHNTIGIYATSRHAATNTAGTVATVDITAASGAHHNLRIHGNQISRVNSGIVLVGSNTGAFMTTGVDVGGISAATGNQFSQFGTGNRASLLPSVFSGAVAVQVNNHLDLNVSNNDIVSFDGVITSAPLSGIEIGALGGTLPTTGSFLRSLNDNRISLRSNGVASGSPNIVGILSASTNATFSTEIRRNDFSAVDFVNPTTAAANATMIRSAGTLQNLGIDANTFSNLSINTTGIVTLIATAATYAPGAVVTISNNAIVGSLSKTGNGNNVTCYDGTGDSGPSVTEIHSNNTCSNVQVTGNTAVRGWSTNSGASPGPRKLISGNTVANVSAGTGPVVAMAVSFSSDLNGASLVSGNQMHSIAGGGEVSGITTSGGSQSFVGNAVHSLSSSSPSAAVVGIQVFGGTQQIVANNRIHNLVANGSGGAVAGIRFSGGGSLAVHNNLIGDLRAPNSTAANALFGIDIASSSGGANADVSYNTVLLGAVSSAAGNFGSSALHAHTTPLLTLRNNVLVNRSTPLGAGLAVAYRRSGADLANYATASNNNLLWAGAPGPQHLIFHNGSAGDETLAGYRARVADRDALAVSANPVFLSIDGSNPDFLRPDPAVATPMESGGLPVAGLSSDHDGQPRDPLLPDIGAFEFSGILLDSAPPAIAYTPPGRTGFLTDRLLAVSIQDPSGVAAGAMQPRIYFRKVGAPGFASSACVGTSPDYQCPIQSAPMGGLIVGDEVEYFVVAQDVLGNLSALPGAGLVASDVNTVTTPPNSPNRYDIVATIGAAITVGSAAGDDFASLTNAGGLFEAVNAGILSSHVVATLSTDLLAETGAVALIAFAEEGAQAGSLTLRIQPSGQRLISGAPVTASGLLRLNGARRVIVDGLDSAGNSLVLRNTLITGSSPVLRFEAGATDSSVRASTIEGGNGGPLVSIFSNNLQIANERIALVGNTLRGLPSGELPLDGIRATTTASAQPNRETLIEGNQILGFRQAAIAVVANARDARILGNQIALPAALTDTQPLTGMQLEQVQGSLEISDNSISGLASTATTAQPLTGIRVTSGSGSLLIARNSVQHLSYAGSANIALNGIQIGSASAYLGTIVVEDNHIGPLTHGSSNASSLLHGIDLFALTGEASVRRNQISGLAHTGNSAAVTRGIRLVNVRVVDVERNRLLNFQPGADSIGPIFGIAYIGNSAGASAVQARVYNNYISMAPTLASAVSLVGIYDFAFAGNVIAADYNSVYIGGSASGAESSWALRRGTLTATAITLRNNLLYNARSGGSGGHYAIGDQSAGAGSWSSNFNLLVGSGTSGSDYLDLGTSAAGTPVSFATWQAGPPQRDLDSPTAAAATVSASDYFADAPAGDLDLQDTAALAIDSGVALAAIGIDIYGSLRGDPPEIGAYEITLGGLTITPDALDFGGQIVGTPSAAITVTLGNSSAIALSVDSLESALTPFALSGGDCTPVPIAIAPGASCTLEYRYTPAAEGANQQVLALVSTAGSGSISLTGTGIGSPLTLVPNPVAFGEQPLGSIGDPILVTVGNAGPGSIEVAAVALPSAPFTQTSSACAALPFTLAAGQSCTLGYRFEPTAAGLSSQDLLFSTVAHGSRVLNLSGTGVQGSLSLSPTLLDFAAQPVATSGERTLTLGNQGNGALNVTGFDPVQLPFARVGGSCPTGVPFALAAAEECTVIYSFSPTLTGAVNQAVAISADAPGSGSVQLQGVGSSVADLAIIKTSDLSLINQGVVGYQLLVSNIGPGRADHVTVSDAFPLGLANIAWSCSASAGAGCAPNGSGDIDESVSLPAGGSLLYSISADSPLPVPISLVNSASVIPSLGVTDPELNNNTDTAADHIVVFRDGFEASTPTIPLAMPDAGKSGTLRLARGLLAAATQAREPAAVAWLQLGDDLALLEAWVHQHRYYVRLLTSAAGFDPAAAAWIQLAPSLDLQLEWSGGPAGTAGRVQLRPPD